MVTERKPEHPYKPSNGVTWLTSRTPDEKPRWNDSEREYYWSCSWNTKTGVLEGMSTTAAGRDRATTLLEDLRALGISATSSFASQGQYSAPDSWNVNIDANSLAAAQTASGAKAEELPPILVNSAQRTGILGSASLELGS